MIDVVYDACVLFSASQRDLLLDIAMVGLARPHWSDEIHEEWIRSLLRKRPYLNRESLERTRRRMDAKFKNSLTKGYEFIIPTLTLPDPDDRHVLAVAIHTKAKYIVTLNRRDFPKTVLQSYGVKTVSPDEFVMQFIPHALPSVLQAVKNHRLSLTCPPKTVDEYLATLEKQGLSKTVALLLKHQDEL